MRDHPNAVLVRHCYDAFAAGEVEETVSGDGAPLGTTDASTK